MNTSSLNEDHLSAQIAKLMAETAKINTEARWYPWVVIAGVFAAALARSEVVSMTSEQHRRIRQALANHRRPPRTPGVRILAAIEHAQKNSPVVGRAMKDRSAENNGAGNAEQTQGNQECPHSRL